MTSIHPALALCFAIAACGGEAAEPPPAPAAPAPPKVDIEAMRAKAAAEIAAEKEKKRAEMRAVGVGSLITKKKAGDKIELHFEFDNKSDKDLMRAEGTLEIKNEAGETIKNLKVVFAQEIGAGKKARKKGRFPIKKDDAGDKAFAEIPLSKLSIEWMPKNYRFADDSTLVAD